MVLPLVVNQGLSWYRSCVTKLAGALQLQASVVVGCVGLWYQLLTWEIVFQRGSLDVTRGGGYGCDCAAKVPA